MLTKLWVILIDNLQNEMDLLKHESIRRQQQMGEMEIQLIEHRGEIDQLNNENDQLKQQIDNINEEMCGMTMRLIDSKGKIAELNEEMAAVKDENRSLRREMETNIGSINQIRQPIEVIETKCQQQIDEVREECEQQLQQGNENAQLGMEKCADEIPMIESKLENIKYINCECFEWQIDKLSLLKRFEWIYSEAFYSGPIGYKMCLAVIIGGNNSIGAGFCLMRGENDDQLNWPFKYSFKVDVINPENGNIFRSKSRKFLDCLDHIGWRKPSNDRNKTIGVYDYGIPIKSAAVKDDKLLFRCKIERF